MSLVKGWNFSEGFKRAHGLVLEKWWNAQWKRNKVVFVTRPNVKMDVTRVFDTNHKEESELKKLADLICKGLIKNDDKAFAIFRWVWKNIQYVYDEQAYNAPDFWQTAYETYQLKKGDCEDSHILQMKLLQLAGIPAYRRKLAAGWVVYPNNQGKAGHAYLIYLREEDNEWYCMDSVYWPEKSEKAWKEYIPQRARLGLYLDIWWTTNEVYSWAQHDMTLSKDLKPRWSL